MTTYIFDTAAIMRNAWANAKRLSKLNSERRFFKFGRWVHANEGISVSPKDCFSEALTLAWNDAKISLIVAKRADINKSGNYIELVWVADAKNLNRGEAFTCTSDIVDSNSINPSFEDESVCYVYA